MIKIDEIQAWCINCERCKHITWNTDACEKRTFYVEFRACKKGNDLYPEQCGDFERR